MERVHVLHAAAVSADTSKQGRASNTGKREKELRRSLTAATDKPVSKHINEISSLSSGTPIWMAL
jgi:hypothetical protein